MHYSMRVFKDGTERHGIVFIAFMVFIVFICVFVVWLAVFP